MIPRIILLAVSPHILYLFRIIDTLPASGVIPAKIIISVVSLFFLIRFALHTPKPPVEINLRFRIMMGGRRIFIASLCALFLQIPLVILGGKYRESFQISRELFLADIVTTSAVTLLFLLNGAIRIFLTSGRLGLTYRVPFIVFSWIPIVNIALGLYGCRIVKKEYTYEILKTERQNARAQSQICATRYPLLLLHGIGFRDYEYINYWGRIPTLLIKNGAVIEYGRQQAWGTIENCGMEIKDQLLAFLEKTGSKKVNIIAHSKGGLDARYMISSLNMAGKVASPTTISTPHRGSELMNTLFKMKESRYKKLCEAINNNFRKLGDKNPDAYSASRQLSPTSMETFNKENPDRPEVYYQSYAAVMKKPTSHALLSIPFAVMKLKAGNNDGLVTEESAKWGVFKGTFKSAEKRGISHADQIDLMRKDYSGFDIAEEYVAIVAELKKMGF